MVWAVSWDIVLCSGWRTIGTTAVGNDVAGEMGALSEDEREERCPVLWSRGESGARYTGGGVKRAQTLLTTDATTSDARGAAPSAAKSPSASYFALSGRAGPSYRSTAPASP